MALKRIESEKAGCFGTSLSVGSDVFEKPALGLRFQASRLRKKTGRPGSRDELLLELPQQESEVCLENVRLKMYGGKSMGGVAVRMNREWEIQPGKGGAVMGMDGVCFIDSSTAFCVCARQCQLTTHLGEYNCMQVSCRRLLFVTPYATPKLCSPALCCLSVSPICLS